ncbi:MAG: polyphosphate kinase 2 family protein [Solirubrobacterales bacterium]
MGPERAEAGRLEEVDLSLRLSRREEEVGLSNASDRLAGLRLALGGLSGEQGVGPPVCVIFEGWDASGKGGSIKRLVAPLDPRHVRVEGFGPPTTDERRHHFLWRFWPSLPGWGGMAVFDRSWYGRVLVERVDELATREQWLRAYDEINSFERTLADEGTILVKIWLHISEEEQLRRFERRASDPLRSWKLTDADWTNREKRGEYERAVEDMVSRTEQPHAPWHLVAAESKRYARVAVMAIVNEAIEAGMRRWGIEPPPATQ